MSQSADLLNSFTVVRVQGSCQSCYRYFWSGRVTLCPFLLDQLFNSGLSNMKLYEGLETESTYPYTHPYSNDSFLPSQGSGSEVGTRGGNIDYPRLERNKK